MNRRNQILALICLLIFAALGVLYFQNWVVQKPFGIILFIGEGLTTQRLAAARLYSAGADARLTLDSLDFSARLRNYSADFAVPDSSAAATALATGSKVKNGTLSVDESGTPLRTILEIAHDEGRATGIVTDGALTNPTIAAFYAHNSNAKQPHELANVLIGNPTIDIALGGGSSNFDKSKLDQARIRLARNLPELEEISDWQRPQVLGIFADGDFAFTDELTARAEKPSLADMVRRAIELLQLNRRGYVLVVDAHLMASAAWQNQGERVLRETLELDRAVQTAREYAGANLTIMVTGDVAIGGMNVNGFPFRYDRGVAILGLNSSGQPWITWATGPNGGKIPDNATQDGERSLKAIEPAAVEVPFALNTVEDVVASASGPRTEKLHGTIENTRIFSILRDAL
jgi:alkaline phosphatase